LAVTALSLMRDGLVGLDDPILDQPFTLRQLLRHEATWSANEMMRRLTHRPVALFLMQAPVKALSKPC
jgi:hypothetical protein